jgi:predicted nucleic acid-binding protein
MVEFGHVYVDASVIVAATLDQPGALRGVRWAAAVSSELIVAELLGTLDRLRLTSRTPDGELAQLREEAERNLAKLDLVPIDRAVLRRAGGAFPMPVKTLDAIHLATALLWGEQAGEIVFLTLDRQLANAARACGLTVYPDSARHAAGH